MVDEQHDESSGEPANPFPERSERPKRRPGPDESEFVDSPAPPPLPMDDNGDGVSIGPGAASRIKDLRREVRDAVAVAGATANEVADLISRLDDLEARLTPVVERINDVFPPDVDHRPNLVPTLAMGWSHLGREDAERAWAALAEWVDVVLCRQYRPTRRELPDCWPVHPRAVREIAWLRNSYLAAARNETKSPGAAAEWHVRWYSGALTNIGSAIDPLECAPGRHRVTEHERAEFERAVDQARRSGEPLPALSVEVGADRPRYRPEVVPLRRDGSRGANQDEGVGTGRRGGSRVGSPTPPSGAAFWMPYYREAVAEDLDNRPRGRVPEEQS